MNLSHLDEGAADMHLEPQDLFETAFGYPQPFPGSCGR